jgi:hypothetical protein
MKRSVTLATVILTLFLFCSPVELYSQTGIRTLPRTLDQLVDEAETIVHGYVLSARIEPHPQLKNLMTVVVTMSIKNTYKGKPQTSLIFRQYAWGIDRLRDSSGYRKGEELVIFLRPISEYGLTSPAGLEQGRFEVSVDRRTGQLVAVNGRANSGLFNHIEEYAAMRRLQLPQHVRNVIRAHPSGPMPFTDFENVIDTLVRPH